MLYTVIIIIIYLIIFKVTYHYIKNEGFNGSPYNENNNCSTKTLTQADCYKCVNCGWGIDNNGIGSCQLGSKDKAENTGVNSRSWFYRGKCIKGPDCGHTGSIYISKHPVTNPWSRIWKYVVQDWL